MHPTKLSGPRIRSSCSLGKTFNGEEVVYIFGGQGSETSKNMDVWNPRTGDVSIVQHGSVFPYDEESHGLYDAQLVRK